MFLSHHALLLVVAATGTWATRSAVDDSHLGCFAATDSVIASLTSLGTFTFQSVGYCKNQCADSSVAALLNGSTCLCGDIVPTASDMVDSSMCSTICPGYAMMTCMLFPFFFFSLSLSPMTHTCAKPAYSPGIAFRLI